MLLVRYRFAVLMRGVSAEFALLCGARARAPSFSFSLCRLPSWRQARRLLLLLALPPLPPAKFRSRTSERAAATRTTTTSLRVTTPSSPLQRRPARLPPPQQRRPSWEWEGRDGRDHDHLFASHWRGYVTYLPAAQNELSRRGRNCWPFGQVSTDRRCGRSTSDASHCIHEQGRSNNYRNALYMLYVIDIY